MVIPHTSHTIHVGNPPSYQAAVREFLTRG